MWIRSQDRKKLIEIHDVTIYHDKQIWAGCSFIGEYSTEEKALEVLDKIQTSIMTEHQFYTEDVNCIGKYFTKEYKEIYQMPQDDEVEV